MRIMKYFLLSFSVLVFTNTYSQQFVKSGLIEYEVKTNMYKSIGSGSWEEKIKDNMSKFKTGYFNLVLMNKAVYTALTGGILTKKCRVT